MPRNGSGTYTVPITFVAGTTAKASDVNTDFTDVGTALTGSLPRDGQAGMTAQLPIIDGSSSTPGLGFSSEPTLGAYRAGAGTFGITGDLSVTGQVLAGGGGVIMPSGVVLPYAGASAPTGWFFCYGQPVSRTTYATLFGILGITFGPGDGTTTFNLPDMRGSIPVGKIDMGGSASSNLNSTYYGANPANLAAIGGSQSLTMVQANLPNVNFTVSGTFNGNTSGSLSYNTQHEGSGGAFSAWENAGTVMPVSGTINGNAASGGNSTPMSRIPPSLILNYIIKT